MPLNITEKKRKRQEEAANEAIAKAAKMEDGAVVTSERGRKAAEELAALSMLPSIAVFDLDDTLWVGDIDMTKGPPFTSAGRGLPVLAREGGHGDKVVPLPHVPEIFDWLEANGIKVAVSTHTFKPEWAEEALRLQETAGGTSYFDLVVNEIKGKFQRKPKDVHLNEISSQTGIPCSAMVFFDDKEHNVGDARRAGAVSCITSAGLSWDNFVQCFSDFDRQRTGGSAPSGQQPSLKGAAVPQTAAAKAKAWAPKTWKPPAAGAAPGAHGSPLANPRFAALAAQWGFLGPGGAAWGPSGLR